MASTDIAVIVVCVATVGLYLWTAAALAAVLRKASAPAWQAWVPVVNTVALLRLGGFSGWWVLLGFVPVVGIALVVVLIIAFYRITIAFDFGGGMTVLAVLLMPVWLSVLGWGSADWLGHDDPPGRAPTRHRDDALDARLSGPLVALPFPFDSVTPEPAPVPSASPASRIPVVAPVTVAASASASAPAPAVPPEAPAEPEAVEWPVRSRRSAQPVHDELSDTSAEVSAGVDAPRLGEPRAASGAVSALWRVPEVGASDDPVDETVVVARRRALWQLTPPSGAPTPVTGDVVIIGRRPSADPSHPLAQLIAVADETRTMSKTHARLERRDDVWTIVDLDSTNGVFLLRDDGEEQELAPGEAQPVGERFLLGDAEIRFGPVG